MQHRFRRFRLFLLGALFLFGLTLFGIAPTGFVVGQAAQHDSETASALAGGLVIIVSLALVAGEINWAKRKREEKERMKNEQEISVL